MQALLLKDFYVLRGQFLVIIGLMVALAFTGDSALLVIAFLLGGASIPNTALSYDAFYRFQKLEKAMPFSLWQRTFSKYVMGYIAMGFSWVMGIVVMLLGVENITLAVLWQSICYGVILLSLHLPVNYWLGAEKARIGLFIIVFGLGYVVNMAMGDIGFSNAWLQINQHGFALTMVSVGINVVSVLISLALNMRKEV